MAASFDFQLVLAFAIVALGIAVFAWHFWSTTRQFGLAMSEGRAPRRYLILGVLAGLGLLYMARR